MLGPNDEDTATERGVRARSILPEIEVLDATTSTVMPPLIERDSSSIARQTTERTEHAEDLSDEPPVNLRTNLHIEDQRASDAPPPEEATMLDVAAQLGIAPLPSALGKAQNKAAPPKQGSLQPEAGHAAKRSALPSPTAPDAGAPSRGAEVIPLFNPLRTSAGSPTPRGVARVRGETIFQHLPRWLFLTQSASKVIPSILTVLLLVSMLGVATLIFSHVEGRRTPHVELRFLSTATAPGEAQPQPGAARPKMILETKPPGVLVVLNQKIMGQTPLEIEVPSPTSHVGIELASPYFETFVGEARASSNGTLRIEAELLKKR